MTEEQARILIQFREELTKWLATISDEDLSWVVDQVREELVTRHAAQRGRQAGG